VLAGEGEEEVAPGSEVSVCTVYAHYTVLTLLQGAGEEEEEEAHRQLSRPVFILFGTDMGH
jgi:hypothetical protein